MPFAYWIRYGLGHQAGRFASDWAELPRGQTVVVRSHRGVELGEVLTREAAASESSWPSDPRATDRGRVLRTASPADLETARRLALQRSRCFELCKRVIQDHDAALQLIDVEPLLDDGRVVLYYLGPHHLDAAALRAALWSTCAIDGLLEPAGRDGSGRPGLSSEAHHGCGHCGSSGGVPDSGDRRTAGAGSARGACSDCATRCVLATARGL